MDAAFATLCHLLRARASSSSTHGFRFLESGDVDGPTRLWSWRDLDDRARRIGGRLQDLGFAGERALLVLPPGLDFIAAFFGCVYGGAIAVPAYPPDPARLAGTLPRLQGIVRDARPAVILTITAVEQLIGGIAAIAPELAVLETIAVDAADPGWADAWRAPALAPDQPAFLQYTSGSTAAPRGVVVSHANVLANQRMIAAAYEVDDPSCVSWLPPYHDMGLIGTVLGPIYQDVPATLLSPLDFLRQPLRWLRAISRFRASVSGGPDFSYALCARKATPAEVATLDLSCWQLAFSGAEPVRSTTLRRFASVFGDAGFAPRRLFAAYGLAEATLLVAGGRVDLADAAGGSVLACDAEALSRGRVVIGRGCEIVSCGAPATDTEVAILRPDGRAAEPDEVGEIGVRGPAVASGYWERPAETAEVFAWRSSDGRAWLRTGDLGFVRAGRLYVTGRSKDVIVLRGRNHYPQDLEATVEACHPAIRAGCVAAFATSVDGEDGLAVVAEIAAEAGELASVEAAIRGAIAEHHALRVDAVVLIAPHTIPKTSSGKLQRQATRRAWLDGSLTERLRSGAIARPHGLPGWLVELLVREGQIPAARIAASATLQELGLDSLATVQLAAAIEERIEIEVPVEMLVGRTLAELADWVDHTRLPTSFVARPDLEAAAADDPSERKALERRSREDQDDPSEREALERRSREDQDDPSERKARAPGIAVVGPRPGEDGSLLLTGATGSLGSYLLCELLARSGRRVICLVRARDADHARERLRGTAQRLGLALDLARVDIICGDLAAPRLGLADGGFAALAARTWRIVHAGARVDWAASFEDLRATNVGGTIELVRLAALGGAIPIVHVSSLGVYPLGLSSRTAFDEAEPVREGERLRVPYFQSKWTAERALEHAAARGIPVTVIRPGFVTPDSRTGVELAPGAQLFTAFVTGAIRLGAVPAVDKLLDVVPVDFVAAAIAALALRPEAAAGAARFNLKNPQPLAQAALHELLLRRAPHLASLSYPRWRERVLRLPREDPDNPLARFALYYRTITPLVMRRLEALLATRIPIGDERARAALDDLGVVCPPFDARLVETYLAASGLLPRRACAAAPAPSAHAPTQLDLPALAAPWLGELRDADARAIRLYDQGKRQQWDAAMRLDWSPELDPDNPHAMPDESIPIWGSPVWRAFGEADRASVRRNYQAWQLSQFLAGEQGALLCAARLVQRAPSAAARMFCATQVVDEARHVEVFARLQHKVGAAHPIAPALQHLIDDVLYDARWDVTCLGMQVLIEGLGLTVFSLIRDRSRHPLVAAAHAYVAQDEARHVAFGKALLAAHYRELTAAERDEREQLVIEASYLLRDRFSARELWDHLGLPADRCVDWIEQSGTMYRYRAELFRRVVPVVRAIGLWGPRVRDAYARMGVLELAGVEIDALIAEDERIARQIGARLDGGDDVDPGS
jgi:thioester reductase-like protein